MTKIEKVKKFKNEMTTFWATMLLRTLKGKIFVQKSLFEKTVVTMV
jgi:hypothetical protein